jgi:hypothetical protein
MILNILLENCIKLIKILKYYLKLKKNISQLELEYKEQILSLNLKIH